MIVKLNWVGCFTFLLLFGCKNSANEPINQASSLTGSWEYNFSVGFVDSLDPEHTYLPTLNLKSDFAFEESARFVDWPSRVMHGYKYVKIGSYNSSADTITFTINAQAYLSFADSLQPKPSPEPITPYLVKVRFKFSGDSLALINTTIPNDTFPVWYKKK